MAFDTKKFLSSGGTKVAKTPQQGIQVFYNTKIGKLIKGSGSSSGGGSSYYEPSKKPSKTPAQLTAEVSKEAKAIRQRAKAAGVSPQVQAVREFAANRTYDNLIRNVNSIKGFKNMSVPQQQNVLQKVFGNTPNYFQKALQFYSKKPQTFSRPSGTFSAYEREKGGTISEAFQLGKIRGKLTNLGLKTKGKGILGQASLTGLGFLKGATDAVTGILDLPQTGYKILTKPAVLLQLPTVIKRETKKAGYFLRTSPSQAVGVAAGNIVAFEGTSRGINTLSELSKAKITKLLPKYLGEAKTGDTLRIPVEGKAIELKVVGSIPKETISKQLSRAGTDLDYAISSQQNKLVDFIRSGKVVRKPIPGEEGFDAATKKLLKEFDKGKITKNNLIKLDQRIRKYGSKGILERSFFVSPGGELRPSRLGILKQNKAKLSDILSGDVTFKKPKPQVLVFRNIKVEDFPESLKNIVRKIKAGRKLTSKESGKLLEFQLKQSGKFKPLGFISGEKELTLAPGELIRRKKVLGRTIVKGKTVPIVEAEVYKPKGKVKELLKKAKEGTLKDNEVSKLDRLLKKETGIDYDLSGYATKKYLNTSGYKVSSLAKITRYVGKSGFISKKKYNSLSRSQKSKIKVVKFSPRKDYGSPRKGSGKPVSRTFSTKSPSKYPGRSPPKYPGVRGRIPKTTLKSYRVKGSRKVRKLSKAIPTFNVYAKSGRKFVRINKGVLSREDALNKGSFAIDNTTAKTFKIVPAGKKKKISSVPNIEKNYYRRAGYKLREYRIKRGRKFGVLPKYIEKKRYGIDTRGEKKGLSIARYLKARGVRRTSTRKLSHNSKAYKQKLKALRKARRVLISRRKRR